MTVLHQITHSDIWWLKLITILILGGLISLGEWFIYLRLLPRLEHKQYIWRASFVKAIHHPLQFYIWFIVLTGVASITAQSINYNDGLFEILSLVRLLATLTFFFWFGMRFIRRVENAMARRITYGTGRISDETSIHAIAQLSRALIILAIFLMLLQTVGIKMSTLLAFGGIGGIIIGFAARDTLANFVGGMMIFWDRPFSVGDWIRSADREIEGIVENIGWRLTRIRTFDKRPLYVPNGLFSNVIIENPSRMHHRRIKLTLGIRYKDWDKIVAITQNIHSMLHAHPDIETKQTLFVNLTDLAPSSLTILVYTFTKTTDWITFQAIQQDVLLKIIKIVVELGAECAFPTHTVSLPDPVTFIDISKKEL